MLTFIINALQSAGDITIQVMSVKKDGTDYTGINPGTFTLRVWRNGAEITGFTQPTVTELAAGSYGLLFAALAANKLFTELDGGWYYCLLTTTAVDSTATPFLVYLQSKGALVLPVMQGAVYTAVAVQSREVVIVQGDTPRLTFDLDADYTGWTIKFGAKAQVADAAYVIAVKDGVWTDAGLGQGYVDLTAAET